MLIAIWVLIAALLAPLAVVMFFSFCVTVAMEDPREYQ